MTNRKRNALLNGRKRNRKTYSTSKETAGMPSTTRTDRNTITHTNGKSGHLTTKYMSAQQNNGATNTTRARQRRAKRAGVTRPTQTKKTRGKETRTTPPEHVTVRVRCK